MKDLSFIDNKESGEQLAKDFGIYVNSFSFDTDAAVDKMMVQDNISFYKQLGSAWIESLHKKYTSGEYDGRNEYACRIGDKIFEYSKICDEALINNKEANKFIDKMRYEHRTLQQSFSGIIFSFLIKVNEGTKNLAGIEELEDFTRCPMI